MDRKQIMVIDDDAETLDFMVNQLEVLYDVGAYLSGNKALETLRKNRGGCLPDLILLDISMKEMDGYEVLDHLKADEEFKKIPVVFLTGMTDEVSEIRGLPCAAAT